MALNSLREMLLEYKRIKDEIPAVLQPPMKPFCDRVEEALLPGVTALTWTALNVEACKKVCLNNLVNWEINFFS